MQKRTRTMLAWLSGGGFGIYMAVRLLNVVISGIESERTDHANDRAADREAIREVAVELRSLTKQLRDREQSDAIWRQAMLDQMAARSVTRPYVVKPLK